MRNKFLSAALVATFALGSTGCVKKMMLDSQIRATRIGAGAADSLGDFEVARGAAASGVMQFEGMHRLAPDNEDALFMLLRGWMSWGYAFAQDDYEVALLKEDDDAAEYHKERAKHAFDRAIGYGLELVGKRDGGFDAAKKTTDSLTAWLEKTFDDREDAETLFWLGSAWLARVNLLKDEPEYVAELYVGVAILDRSRVLDPALMAWGATSTLAAYHARSRIGELDRAKELLDLALAKTERKSLGVLVNYAKYACSKDDKGLYEKVLNEVIDADTSDPTFRLQNVIAKRRAKRGLHKTAIEDCGFSEPEPAPAPAEEPAPASEEASPAPTEAAPSAS